MNIPSFTYNPIAFFLITLLGTWFFGFIVAYLSHEHTMPLLQAALLFAGLLVPCITALSMMYGSKNSAFISDFWSKMSLSKVGLCSLITLSFLMLMTVLLATAISLLFGKPYSQFTLSTNLNILKGQGILSILIFFLAPLCEELGWRGYGVDSLRKNFGLFGTNLLFALLWALWHVPLFFIKGYYQYELWHSGTIYAINFFISFIPISILMNWIYYHNDRSIVVAIFAHFMFNFCSVLFQTEQFTKCIITILLLIISTFINFF